MKEITGDIWDYHDKGNWIVITTNGTVRKDGACVMGRGVALEAKNRFPKLPYLIGDKIKRDGLWTWAFPDYRIISLPVKYNWYEKATLELIEDKIVRLVGIVDFSKVKPIYLVRPGCGNGGLDWRDVKPILEKYLDDRFIVVERETT